ncbi:cobyric acid synthase [Fictibacillus macauensis ZFHKF-1]|uniref:Cobyric acid synthase n=1 Tax=Fictibacillus macauensis ZFHKF-1 TaxID=1196324 RepID=I8ALI8_9BACL|nr:cobyric acid synthase [Fictibacillus macauensis]EIT86459.1 cobyric acid synthase [Fictibacillus macauensis ZFHKF-1]
MRDSLSIMVQGTHSDAGKSVITTALCRIFSQDGYRTAPFKSQNMALNSYITIDGREIGRAQGVQAEAAGIEATTYMNPILIKPSRENDSQIVVHGKPYKNMNAFDYRRSFYNEGLRLIEEAIHCLYEQYECVVIEGAGSPAEINLNDRELVNMKVAQLADAPVILVGDIEKGGVFASLVGTLQLVEKEDRARIVGVVINKFRGDVTLLEPGLSWFEEYTGVPVLGVIPYIPNLTIEAEDSVVLSSYQQHRDAQKLIDIAVIQYPMISNFTDIDPFFAEEDCSVRFVKKASELHSPDLLILPGSKNTIEDLQHLKNSGLYDEILQLANQGKTKIFGICGGYQMLGTIVRDPDHVETTHEEERGLGLLPITTTLLQEKTTVRSQGVALFAEKHYEINGYEIHMGQSVIDDDANRWIQTQNGHLDGVKNETEQIIGTYFHHLFHNDEFRLALLNQLRVQKGAPKKIEPLRFLELREESFNTLADHVRTHVNMDKLYEHMRVYQENRMLKRSSV